MFQPTPFLLLMRQRDGTSWQASNESACHGVEAVRLAGDSG